MGVLVTLLLPPPFRAWADVPDCQAYVYCQVPLPAPAWQISWLFIHRLKSGLTAPLPLALGRFPVPWLKPNQWAPAAAGLHSLH